MKFVRLNDREKRTGRKFFRKRVYLRSDHNAQSVLIKFHSNYKKIFENYVEAYSVIPRELIGQLYVCDTDRRIIEAEYMGEPLANERDGLAMALATLSKINSLKIKRAAYIPPRYISDDLFMNTENFTSVNRLSDKIKACPIIAPLGVGVEDPAVSNFVTNDHHVYLIDLDNYGEDFNIDTMLGFLIVDSLLNKGDDLSLDNIISYATSIRPSLDMGLMLCGAIGRVAVILIDNDTERQHNDSQVAWLVEELAERAYVELYDRLI